MIVTPHTDPHVIGGTIGVPPVTYTLIKKDRSLGHTQMNTAASTRALTNRAMVTHTERVPHRAKERSWRERNDKKRDTKR